MLSLLAACAHRAAPVAPPRDYRASVRVSFDATAMRADAKGLADPLGGGRVTPDDPVRVASVSKLVVALGVMRMVEAGTVDLDRDVSDYLGWRLRHPRAPDTPITLRLLLSHRAGLSDAGERYIIPYGALMRDRLAEPGVWADAPGARFRYANLGFPVIASVIERASGERFDRLMARLVFATLRIDACFGWTTCSPAATARAVVLHDADGRIRRDGPGDRPPACPVFTVAACDLDAYRLGDNGAIFSPQGGMRISMNGLARIGQMIVRGGEGFLTPASIETLFAAVPVGDGETESGFSCAYGLATQTIPTRAGGCRDALFADGRTRVGHAGEAYGLRSGLWIDRARGRGVAFFATAVPDGEAGARSAYSRTEEALARD